MAKKKSEKSIQDVLNSTEYKELVESTIQDMNAVKETLKNNNWSEEEAKKKIQQLHFQNLKHMSDPAAAAMNTLAELKTRADVHRILNPEEDPLNQNYMKLLEEMRKTIKLVNDTQGKTITHQISQKDDKTMEGFTFIDVEGDNNDSNDE